ncbi:CPBP family intramembrane glutamic endopeptidase [Lysobacter firmicutimachus]|uniref:CPBP family intramembrane glutamic endopeptidase n=2 Tax=Lysobacter TaxID=68 RepID=A0AAU8MUS3_9GAMM
MAIAALLAFALIGGVAWTFVLGLQGVPPDRAMPGPGAAIALSLVATGLAAVLVYALRRPASRAERRASLQAWRNPWTYSWVALTVIACVGFSALVGLAAQSWQIEMRPSNAVLGEAIRNHPLLLLLFAALIAPAYEELLFRRVLFGRLWAAGRPGLGMALSSLAFALVHEPPGLGASHGVGMLLLWVVYAFMGAAFAWVYRQTGSLWTAYAAHALNNLIAGAALLTAGA